MRVFNPIMVLAAALVLFAGAQAGEAEANQLRLKAMMTADDFEAAGLGKLSNGELSHLEAWLENHCASERKQSPQQTSTGTPDVIESQIEGEFKGWTGETIFKLTNGQIWQQAEYDYTYEYAFMPEVTIYKTQGGYKMKVEDVEETIYVKRLK
jgi:hypothetical protein